MFAAALATVPMDPIIQLLQESLFENALDGVLFGEAARGLVLRANPAACRMLGLGESELVGKERLAFVVDDAALERLLAERRAKGSVTGALEFRRADGTTFPVEITSILVPGPSGKDLACTTFRDVSERKREEAAARAREDRSRRAEEFARFGHWEFLLGDRVVHGSEGAARVYGLATTEMPLPEIQACVLAEFRPLLDETLRDLVERGAPYDLEFRIRRASDGAIVDVHSRAEFDPGTRRVFGIVQDITQRKSAEVDRNRLQDQLAQTARLAALGTLAAGVGHAVNTPLTAALASDGFAAETVDRLREALRSGRPAEREWLVRELDAVAEALSDAKAGEERVAAVVKDFSAFGKASVHMSRVRLLDVLDGSMRWLPTSVAAAARIRVERGDAPDVIGSAGQLQQVLVNLVTNAAKAIPAGRRGTITVELGGSGDSAFVEVSDDGVGMPPEVLRQAFDPFFTTRRVGEGMGLGLAIAHAIVNAHGGTLTATSRPGQGSTFRVELPAAPPEA